MSFNIALTGLSAVNEKLDAVSNNIANVGTTGFKSSRAEFGSIYADTQAMGVEVLGLTQSISQGGSIVGTGRSLDLAISGGGFYINRASNGDVSYSRAGVFGTDTQNNLVNASGQFLQGYPVDAQNNLQIGTVSNLQLRTTNIPAQATDNLDFVLNLDANEQIPSGTPFDPSDISTYNSTYTTKMFDSQGKEHTLTQYFVKTSADNTWNAYYYVDGKALESSTERTFDANGVPVNTETNVRTGTGTALDPWVPEPIPLVFNTSGHMTYPYDYAGVLANDPLNPPNHAEITLNHPLETDVLPLAIELNYGGEGIGGATQFGSDFVVNRNDPSGYASGEQTGISVEKDGKVYATYSNGERMLQGQVVLANFANLDGLKNVNGTSWVETSESGQPLIGVAGTGQYGVLNAGALESSNVDLTQQLVELMEGQRNYQANTKVLSTDKELTQVLFNAI